MVGEEEEGSMCGEATKGTARKASMFCKGKSTEKGKRAKESRKGEATCIAKL